MCPTPGMYNVPGSIYWRRHGGRVGPHRVPGGRPGAASEPCAAAARGGGSGSTASTIAFAVDAVHAGARRADAGAAGGTAAAIACCGP